MLAPHWHRSTQTLRTYIPIMIRMNMVCTYIAQLNKHSGNDLSVKQNAPLPQGVPQAVVERQLLLRFQEENLEEIPIHHNLHV